MLKEIKKTQYYQLVGLLSLAQHSLSKLNDIEASIKKVVKTTKADENNSGIGDPQHICDAIYSDYSVETLLEKLGIVEID